GGPRVAVVSNAGGAGVLAADACEREGLTMAELSEATLSQLKKLLPAEAAVRNPVDTTAAVPAGMFADALRIVLADDGVDAVLAKLHRYAQWLNRTDTPAIRLSGEEALPGFVQERLGAGDQWLSPEAGVELLRLAGIPMIETRYVAVEDSMAAATCDLDSPVVVKADAVGLLHKSAGGGVLLNVRGADRILDAFRTLRSRFGS